MLAALATLADADACVFASPLCTDTATPLCCPRRLSPPSVRGDVAGGSSRRARKMKKVSLQQEAACLAPLSSLHGSPLGDLRNGFIFSLSTFCQNTGLNQDGEFLVHWNPRFLAHLSKQGRNLDSKTIEIEWEIVLGLTANLEPTAGEGAPASRAWAWAGAGADGPLSRPGP